MRERSDVARGGSRWLSLGTLPAVCVVFVGLAAAYMLLVVIGNITDYGTNFAYVEHVLSMDTTNFGAPAGQGLDPDVMWRAIDVAWAHHVVYVAIIVWESLVVIVLASALVSWFRSRGSQDQSLPRRLSSLGLLMMIVLFMGGFIVVGGEWFDMWRSRAWNGVEPAYRNSVLAAIGLILLNLPSPQWAGRSAETE